MEVRVQDEWWAMGLRGDTRVGLEWRFFFEEVKREEKNQSYCQVLKIRMG